MICASPAELEFSTTSPLPRFFLSLSSPSSCLFLHHHHQTRLLCSAVVSWGITNQTLCLRSPPQDRLPTTPLAPTLILVYLSSKPPALLPVQRVCCADEARLK